MFKTCFRKLSILSKFWNDASSNDEGRLVFVLIKIRCFNSSTARENRVDIVSEVVAELYSLR